jgi:hypothetical protein
MSSILIFEQAQRGDSWRLEVAAYKGKTFLNFRKWYRAEDGLRPTREGVTIPLERLPELTAALSAVNENLAGHTPTPSPDGG